MSAQADRRLTVDERIEARHWLQQLAEQARLIRDAMDPNHGNLRITVEVWTAQWAALRRDLDAFTARVEAGKVAVGSAWRDRNSDGY